MRARDGDRFLLSFGGSGRSAGGPPASRSSKMGL
jgi:hypothetical protein